MDLPENLLHHIDIKRWQVFYGKYPPGSDKSHVCIVVNSLKQEEMCYVFMTSQDEKHEKLMRDDPLALVRLSTEKELIRHYFPSTDKLEKTVIPCNEKNIHFIAKADLLSSVNKKESKLEDLVHPIIASKIIEGIRGTKTLSDDEKDEILGEFLNI